MPTQFGCHRCQTAVAAKKCKPVCDTVQAGAFLSEHTGDPSLFDALCELESCCVCKTCKIPVTKQFKQPRNLYNEAASYALPDWVEGQLNLVASYHKKKQTEHNTAIAEIAKFLAKWAKHLVEEAHEAYKIERTKRFAERNLCGHTEEHVQKEKPTHECKLCPDPQIKVTQQDIRAFYAPREPSAKREAAGDDVREFEDLCLSFWDTSTRLIPFKDGGRLTREDAASRIKEIGIAFFNLDKKTVKDSYPEDYDIFEQMLYQVAKNEPRRAPSAETSGTRLFDSCFPERLKIVDEKKKQMAAQREQKLVDFLRKKEEARLRALQQRSRKQIEDEASAKAIAGTLSTIK